MKYRYALKQGKEYGQLKREELYTQVKAEYAQIASEQSRRNTMQSTAERTPEEYYEGLLDAVMEEISRGTFDSFRSGREIVEAVASDSWKWIPRWNPGE